MIGRYFRNGPLVAAALATMLAVGCSKGATVESYKPPEDAAQAALEAALAQWKEGGKCEPLEASSFKVQPNDFDWRAGKKLTAYEILGAEDEKGINAKKFNVKITLDGAAQEVAYYIVGKAPDLMVFRDKDYKNLSGTGQ